MKKTMNVKGVIAPQLREERFENVQRTESSFAMGMKVMDVLQEIALQTWWATGHQLYSSKFSG